MTEAAASPPPRQANAEETALVVVTCRVEEQPLAYSEADEWPG